MFSKDFFWLAQTHKNAMVSFIIYEKSTVECFQM